MLGDVDLKNWQRSQSSIYLREDIGTKSLLSCWSKGIVQELLSSEDCKLFPKTVCLTEK